MKALSVRQPWASLIADGNKTIETRTWRTTYRGPLLICSSKTPANRGPAGVALCVVDLIDCRKMIRDDERFALCDIYEGAFSWVLSDVRPLKPFPVKGRLGIWEYMGDRKTCRQLGHCTYASIDCRDGDDKCPVWYPADSLFFITKSTAQANRARGGCLGE